MEKNNSKKLGIGVFTGEMFLGASSVIYLMYAYYCFTDLGKVDISLVTMVMFGVSVVSFIWSLFSGIIVQNTRTKNGQYRPWFFWGTIVLLAGTFMMLVKFDSMGLTCAVIALGYLLLTMAVDPQCTGKYGIYEKMSAGDSTLRNTLNGMSAGGVNFGYIIYSYCFLYLVAFLGGDNELKGFRLAQVVLSILALIGMVIIYRMAKPYDTDNRGSEEEKAERVNLKEMFKSVLVNRCMMAMFVGDIIRYTGYTVLCTMMMYQTEAVLGDMYIYSSAMAFCSIMGVIGSLIAPKLIQLVGGRKKASILFEGVAGICYIIIGFTGTSAMGIMIPFLAGSLFQYIADSVNILMYLDAGEIWYNKTGNDTRAFSMSLQNFTYKVAAALSSLCIGGLLIVVNYTEGITLEGAAATLMTRLTGFVPGAFFLIFSLCLIFVHNVSDKDVERIIKENAEKDGFSMYDEM